MLKNNNFSNILKFSLGLFIGIFITCIAFSTYVFAVRPIKLIINGKTINMEVTPHIINGRTMVPARYVAENLGATVEWDGDNNTIIINRSANTALYTFISKLSASYFKSSLNNNDDVVGESWNSEYPTDGATASSTYAKTGTKSLRMELNRTDPIINGSKRCEIARDTAEGAREEHWYIFSVYLPKGGDEDYTLDPDGSEILAQWHNVPDTGEAYTSPPLALRTIGNNWRIDRLWDTNATSTNKAIMAHNQFENVIIGTYKGNKGKWTDWAFHVRWGWLPEHKPILEVYKNGVLVLERNGEPNMTNDQLGVYMKLGIYKWDWAQEPDIYSIINRRVVYYDAVIIL